MTLQQFRALVAVADAGTFGAAALDLGISQGAVSQSIASFEREIGVRVFERGRDGARVTEVGSRILAHARNALRFEIAVREEASLEQGELEAQLEIEAFASVLTTVLPAALAHLGREHPQLAVDLRQPAPKESIHSSLGTVSSLLSGQIDVGFVQLPLGEGDTTDDLLVWTLLEEPYVAVIAKRHYRAVRESGCLDLAILEHLPLALDVSEACAMVVRSYLLAHVGRCNPRFRADDSTMIQLAAQGAAVGFMPSSAARSLPDEVVRVELDDAPVRQIAVAIAPTGLKIPAVRVFLDALRRGFPDAGLPPQRRQMRDVREEALET